MSPRELLVVGFCDWSTVEKVVQDGAIKQTYEFPTNDKMLYVREGYRDLPYGRSHLWWIW